MNREVCEHFNPVDLPCAKCAEKRKSEAMFLADELEAPLGTIIGAELYRRAAAELRRLHAQRGELLEALRDMYDGWKYIRSAYGDLYGVGWDRCDEKARAAIAKAEDER